MPAPLFAHYGDKMFNIKFDGSLGFGVDGGINVSLYVHFSFTVRVLLSGRTQRLYTHSGGAYGLSPFVPARARA